MTITSTAKRIASLTDSGLSDVFKTAAFTPGDDHTVIHHLAAIEMRKRSLPLGRRSPYHRRSVIVDAAETTLSNLGKASDARARVAVVLDYDGFGIRAITDRPVVKEEGVRPPERVRAAARRALGWIEEGKQGSGFTSVGRRRAQQLADGEPVSADTIRRMRSFFSRHEVNRSAKGFKQGQEGFPSPGRVAWDAWGGDAGRSWANQQFRRQEASKARPENPWKRGYNTEYFHNRDEMLAKGPKCAMCKTKKATEVDHIRSLKDGGSNAKSNLRPVCAPCNRRDGGGERADAKKRYISKAVSEKRYTLGPMYIPNSIDAQNEWTDEEELQQAVWKYVRSGDRRIRLQHNRDVVAGEWVECMAWPYEVSVPMLAPDGTADTVEFPPNTVFLGVVWEPWAWDMVKAGSLRGYSIGGAAARVLADLPEAVDSAA